MEEQVGAFWHRLVTRLAEPGYPQAAVQLESVAPVLGILFRALGGDGGLEICAAEEIAHGARRKWLQRLAGTGDRIALAWRDESTLRLPPVLNCFPETALNRDLYLWLAALAVQQPPASAGDWLATSQQMTRETLSRFPGLQPRYRRLVAAHLDLRPDPEHLPPEEAKQERAIRSALQSPGQVAELPSAKRPPQPVPLWLHPNPPQAAAPVDREEDPQMTPSDPRNRSLGARKRKRGERGEMPNKDQGLITIRMENIFSWSEYVKLDRSTDEEEDLDRAQAAAEDLDRIALARDRKAAGARLRFDLDLPAESEDDLILSDGLRLPEWDWKRRSLLPNHCRVQELLALEAPPQPLPPHLRRTAKRLRHQFQALAPARVWQRGQPDGQEVDLDAYLRFVTDRRAGIHAHADGLYRAMRTGARDLACLLIADLSLSTDTWINDQARIIDVIRDSLYLFAESLGATGDAFAMLGFSSRRRDPIRIHQIKGFAEPYSAQVRGRIQAIKPGYYTRMGAAIRYGTDQLVQQPAGRRLLLLLSDGKPNDLDKYEGRYGIEDTRHAVQAARRLGLTPFCVTIDERGNDYLPHLFGTGGYVVIRHPSELPTRLPLLYARLTA